VFDIGVTGIAMVASFSVIEPGTLEPHVRQKRLFAGSSVAHEEQRMFSVPSKVQVFDVARAVKPMWGGRPRPRRTPWSGNSVASRADEGVGCGRGRPPHTTRNLTRLLK
jgi:hypothetical protein